MDIKLGIPFALHQLSAIVWIGGAFFSNVVLRRALKADLIAEERLPLMLRVYQGFFHWLWFAILLQWVSGAWLVSHSWRSGGGSMIGLHVYVMVLVAAILTVRLIFAHLSAYHKLQAAVVRENWPWAAAKVSVLRRVIRLHLILGLIAVLAGTLGPHLPTAWIYPVAF